MHPECMFSRLSFFPFCSDQHAYGSDWQIPKIIHFGGHVKSSTHYFCKIFHVLGVFRTDNCTNQDNKFNNIGWQHFLRFNWILCFLAVRCSWPLQECSFSVMYDGQVYRTTKSPEMQDFVGRQTRGAIFFFFFFFLKLTEKKKWSRIIIPYTLYQKGPQFKKKRVILKMEQVCPWPSKFISAWRYCDSLLYTLFAW